MSYSSPRGGISQITVKGETTASHLLVQEARQSDSGSYACHASVGTISQVMVHVIRSKQVAKNIEFVNISFSGQKPEKLVPSGPDPINISSGAIMRLWIQCLSILHIHTVI